MTAKGSPRPSPDSSGDEAPAAAHVGSAHPAAAQGAGAGPDSTGQGGVIFPSGDGAGPMAAVTNVILLADMNHKREAHHMTSDVTTTVTAGMRTHTTGVENSEVASEDEHNCDCSSPWLRPSGPLASVRSVRPSASTSRVPHASSHRVWNWDCLREKPIPMTRVAHSSR